MYVTGRTKSSDFPTTENALDTGNRGDHDVFISVLDASGGILLYSTLWGGKGYDTGQDLVVDRDHYVYVAGTTRSADFPTSEAAFQRDYSGRGEGEHGGDVFVVELNLGILFRAVTNLTTGIAYTGLQDAVDDAAPSDTLFVDPGHYRENLIVDKSLTIQGRDANEPNTPLRIVLDGTVNLTEPTLLLTGQQTRATIAGLTLRGGSNGLRCDIGVEAAIRNCRLTQNAEAGLYCLGSHPQLRNCLIAANGGDGVLLSKTNGLYPRPTLDNCTIVQNAYNGIQGGKPLITNSIIYFNGADEPIDAKKATVTYSCIEGDHKGKGNISRNPCFVSLGYTSETGWVPGDYRLQSQSGRWDSDAKIWILDPVTSPCINTGDPSSSVGDEPAPNGDRINMGAYGGTSQASEGSESSGSSGGQGGPVIILPPWLQ